MVVRRPSLEIWNLKGSREPLVSWLSLFQAWKRFKY